MSGAPEIRKETRHRTEITLQTTATIPAQTIRRTDFATRFEIHFTIYTTFQIVTEIAHILKAIFLKPKLQSAVILYKALD